MSQALTQAGTLKVEIRLAQAISDFATDLNDSQRTKFKFLKTLAPPTVSEVVRLTEELNHDGSRLHRAWRPYGTRLVSILDKIRLFTKAGDVLVGGSQNMIASGVWAVVRTGLQCATNSLSYFEKVSEIFMRIGRISSIQQDTVDLFPDCQELQEFMCEYLITVLKFCRSMVKFSKKSTLSQFTASMGTSFDPECKEFETNIAMWSRLVDKKVQYLSTHSQLASQRDISKAKLGVELLTSSRARKKAFEERRFKALKHLSPLQSQFDSVWRRERKKGSVHWIKKSERYLDWKTDFDPPYILWIKGILGSGKTVLMANIVADLQAEASTLQTRIEGDIPRHRRTVLGDVLMGAIIASFFCQHNSPQTLTAGVIIGSIQHQILRQLDKDALAKVLNHFDQADRDFGDDFTKFPVDDLPRQRLYFVVIDALDECSMTVVRVVMSYLKSLGSVVRLTLCCSSRTGSTVDEIVGKLYNRQVKYQSMAEANREREMEQFIFNELERRRDLRLVDDKTLDILKQALILGSQGMYLWVVLQIETLFPEHTRALLRDADIIGILDSLHDDLKKSFDRALSRIQDQKLGKKAFQLVAGAARPLHGDELRIALNVQECQTQWDQHNMFKDTESTVYNLGGGLLEIEEEDQTVHFIHHSALQHLLRREHDGSQQSASSSASLAHTVPFCFELNDAANTWARICVTYLNYDCHQRQVSRVRAVVVDGAKATDKLRSAALSQSGTPGKVFAALTRHRSAKSQPFDVVRALEDFRNSRPQTDDVLLLFDYASELWLQHTLRYCPTDPREAALFRKLIPGSCAHAKKPWKDDDELNMFNWALANGHVTIYQMMMHDDQRQKNCLLYLQARLLQPSLPWRITGPDLGNVIALLLHKRLPGYEDSLRALIKLDADPNIPLRPDWPNSSIPIALEMGNMLADDLTQTPTVLYELINAGANVDVFIGSKTPLYMALEYELDFVAEALLKAGAGVKLQEPPPFAVGRDMLVTQLLLDAGISPNSTFLIPSTSKIQEVLPYAQKLPYSSTCPLFNAIQKGDVRCLAMLLNRGATPNIVVDDFTPLMVAIMADNVSCVEALLSGGALSNVRSKTDRDGSELVNPLDYAARHRPPIMQLLLKQIGAVQGAVAWAVESGKLDRTKHWLQRAKNGPPFDLEPVGVANALHALDLEPVGIGKNHETLVQYAARRGFKDILVELLFYGLVCRPGLPVTLDRNMKGTGTYLVPDPKHPLIIAIRAGQRDCALILAAAVGTMRQETAVPVMGHLLIKAAMREATDAWPSDVELFRAICGEDTSFTWTEAAHAIGRATVEDDEEVLQFWLDVLGDPNERLKPQPYHDGLGLLWSVDNPDNAELVVGDTLLHFACRMNSKRLVELLLGIRWKPVDVHGVDLILAIEHHNLEIVHLLVDKLFYRDHRHLFDAQTAHVNPLLAAIKARAWEELKYLEDFYLSTVPMADKRRYYKVMLGFWAPCSHLRSLADLRCRQEECVLREARWARLESLNSQLKPKVEEISIQ